MTLRPTRPSPSSRERVAERAEMVPRAVQRMMGRPPRHADTDDLGAQMLARSAARVAALTRAADVASRSKISGRDDMLNLVRRHGGAAEGRDDA